jgi:molecular chaperone DnaK (HSP70)
MQHFSIDKLKMLIIILLKIKNSKGEFIMGDKDKTKQMVDYHKAAFETYYNSVQTLQEQTTKALDNMLKQSPWIPAQTKSFINEWISIYKKVTTDFKESVDQNYSKMEEFLNSTEEAAKPKSKK